MSQATESYDLIRPLSVGNIVNIGFFVYRSHFKLYFSLAFQANLWLTIPIFVVFSVWALVFKFGSVRISAFWGFLLIVTGTIALIYGVAKFLAASALISRLVFNELMSQAESVRFAKTQLISKNRSFFITGVLVGLILLFSAISLIVAIAIVWFIFFLFVGFLQIYIINLNTVRDRNILLIIGIIFLLLILATVIAFIAGLIWVYARFLIAEVPLAIESNMNPGSTISRSWNLTRKSVTRIQGVITIAFLITLPIQLPIQIFTIVLQKSNSFLYEQLYTLIVVALSLLGGALVLPFWQAVKAVIYYDLRIRQEGLDMQQRLCSGSGQEGSTI